MPRPKPWLRYLYSGYWKVPAGSVKSCRGRGMLDRTAAGDGRDHPR